MSLIQVDVLDPNTFEKTGIVKPIVDAWADGDWIGTFNLWIVQEDNGVGYLLYQQRSFVGAWAPGLLDVTAGGHYEAGETALDGLREVREELGKSYDFSSLHYLGKKLYLRNEANRKLRYLVDIFVVLDNAPLTSFVLERNELEGLYRCPINELIKVHTCPNYSFTANGKAFRNEELVSHEIHVNKDMFPYNWDNYHYKIALLAQRFLRNEQQLIY